MNDHLLQCSNQKVQCPICWKYVLRGFICDHIDSDCFDLLDNTDPVMDTDPHEPISSTFAECMTKFLQNYIFNWFFSI
jgi:hypothetical protein